MFVLPFLAGTWAVLRDTAEGVFCSYNIKQKYPRLEALLEKGQVDDWFWQSRRFSGGPFCIVWAGCVRLSLHCLAGDSNLEKRTLYRAVRVAYSAGRCCHRMAWSRSNCVVVSCRRARRTLANLNFSLNLDCHRHSAFCYRKKASPSSARDLNADCARCSGDPSPPSPPNDPWAKVINCRCYENENGHPPCASAGR